MLAYVSQNPANAYLFAKKALHCNVVLLEGCYVGQCVVAAIMTALRNTVWCYHF